VATALSEDTWSDRDTTPERIEAALRDLLRARHAADATVAPARVLNLVVVVDREWKGEVSNRLDRVGRYHASRTILCAVEEGRTTLDATVVMSADQQTRDGRGVMREQIEMDIGPVHLERLDTLVDPVMASELPAMLWSPHGHREAVDALLEMIDVVLIDSGGFEEPAEGVADALELLEHAYVVDLAWLRTTPWRERLASSFDGPARRSRLERLERIDIRFHPGSTVSALLLAGWLVSRLDWVVKGLTHEDGTLIGLAACGAATSDVVRFSFDPVGQDVPGIAGVTVSGDSGFSLSLDRGRGGLTAHERTGGDQEERSWQVLGASRGEGGILGEGVRQALLRDPTYGPALRAARSFCET
jgi:glucose-6-phosphate dehydrogenase assembly protein OpcA